MFRWRIDTVADLARLGQLLLLVLCAVASRHRREHRPLAIWLTASVLYSIINELWIIPVLGHLPRPFHGWPRVAMHAAQCYLVTMQASMVAIGWYAFKVPRRWLPAPYVIAFAAMFVLIDGYTHARVAGQYRIGAMTFSSANVFAVETAALAFLEWVGVVPRIARVLFEPKDEDDAVASLALLAFLVEGSLGVAVPMVWGVAGAIRAHAALNLGAYLLCIGLYSALFSRSARRFWSLRIAGRLTRLRRLGSMERAHARLLDARRIAESTADGVEIAPPGRYLVELAERGDRLRDADRIALSDRRLSETMNLIAAVTGTLHPHDARAVLQHALAMLANAAQRHGRDWPVRWDALSQQTDVIRRERILSPLTFMVLSTVQDVPLAAAVDALTLASSLHDAAMAREHGSEAREAFATTSSVVAAEGSDGETN